VINSLALGSPAVEAVQQSAIKGVNDLPLTPKPLLHELQLGEQLNECISQTRRADFALMLAMLANDVREQSQFVLPESAETKSLEQNEAKLRAFFDLPDKAPLALKNNEQINLFNQADLLNEVGLESLHLTNAMMPKPLAFRDDVKHIQTNIMTNTSFHCQLKHQVFTEEDNPNSQVLNKSLNFNAKEWLKGIETSLVKAPLIA
jgi:hypothetical protein